MTLQQLFTEADITDISRAILIALTILNAIMITFAVVVWRHIKKR